MRKQLLITVASAALIAGMAAASAQAPDKGGNADRGAPTKMQEAPAQTPKAAPAAKGEQKGDQRAAPAAKVEQKGEQRAAPAAANDKAAPAPKAAQEMDKSKAPSTSTAQGSDKQGSPASKSQAQDKAGAPAPAAQSGGASQTTGQGVAPAGRAGAAVQLDVTQRTRVRELVLKDSSAPRVANVNFSISIGTKVPRDRVQPRPLSTQIIEIVPAYRGYLYFMVGNDIVIVEPNTMEIVAVISA